MTDKDINKIEWHKIECLHNLRGGQAYTATLGYLPVTEGASAIYHCRKCGTMQLWAVSPDGQLIKTILSPGLRVRAPGGRPWLSAVPVPSRQAAPDVCEVWGEGRGEAPGGGPEREIDRVNPVTSRVESLAP